MPYLIRRFLELESSSSLILFGATVIAMIWANSSLAHIHVHFVHHSLFWINEGLMTLFFLLVGLELRRGFTEGELSNASHALLPAVAALGGMLVPVLIYCAVNRSNPAALQGWSTPVATDIAFALGVLSLFGRRVPIALKLFLLALAIFDDVGAILIIALFYSHGVVYGWLLLAMVLMAALFLWRTQTRSLYLVIGLLLWFSLLKAGIHPTITGVVLAFALPENGNGSFLRQWEDRLHPWVALLIMPLFALANAGFALHTLSWRMLSDGVVVGIVLGLFVGKQVGVFFFSWCLIRLGWAKLPHQSSWLDLYGVALLCGIGFTMSLFLGTLSFQNNGIYLAEVRLSVMIGSILSGLVGAAVLLMSFARNKINDRSTSLGERNK